MSKGVSVSECVSKGVWLRVIKYIICVCVCACV